MVVAAPGLGRMTGASGAMPVPVPMAATGTGTAMVSATGTGTAGKDEVVARALAGSSSGT